MDERGFKKTFLVPVILRQVSGYVLLAGCVCVLAQTQPTQSATKTPDANSSSSTQSGTVIDILPTAPNKIPRPQKEASPNASPTIAGGIEILSDTGGVDFAHYMQLLHDKVQRMWQPLIPEVALRPALKSGLVVIEFAIMRDGDIKDIKIIESSEDVALDRAAFGAIANSHPFAPLPVEFSHESLLLRCKFFYNPSKEMDKLQETYYQGLAQIKGKNWGKAEQLMQQAVELDPTLDPAWNNLGRACMYLGHYAAAEAAFRKFLLLRPNDALPYAQLAWALTTERKYAEAAELLEKRIAGEPADGDAHRRLGIAYLFMHRPESALPVLEKASHLLPNNDSAHYQLGIAYLQTHRNDDAASAFERAVAIQGSDTNLK